ncbi:SPOR domain-containing protein [Komagataeibacter rhaeticus]|nr:SPOR domain-containing protein [Komagataeibacter rhaeticus]
MRYLRIITPNLGNEVALSGPLAVYGSSSQRVSATPPPLGTGSPTPPSSRGIPMSSTPPSTRRPPCSAAPPACRTSTRPTTRPAPPAAPIPAHGGPATSAGTGYGAWMVQVGAFSAEGQARFANSMARQGDFAALQGARSMVIPVSRPTGVIYRARLAGLSQAAATGACATLKEQGLPCTVIRPGQ